MVSLIIPCFNGEKFIDRCISSILNQTYKNIELIFINDGSIDDTEKIIMKNKSKIEENLSSFKYIKKSNGGPASAVNEGLKYVTGKFLALLDVDDYLLEDSIFIRRKFLLENKDYDIVRTNGYIVNEGNLDEIIDIFITRKEEKNKEYIFDDLIEGKTNNWSGSYMVRISKLFEFYSNKKIYESKYGQNLQLLLPLAYEKKVGFIDVPLMKYINQQVSLSKHNGDFEKQKNALLGYKDIRVNVIMQICKGDELKKYLDKIEVLYARHLIELAFYYRNKELMNSNFEILRRYKSDTIEDKILYYNLNNKIIEIILRLKKKIM